MLYRIVVSILLVAATTSLCKADLTKVLFVYPNEPNDFGYAYAVELARINAEKVLTSPPFNYSIKTNYLIVGNVSTAVDNIKPFLDDEYKLVLFGGGQFTSVMNKLAPVYPSVKFMGTSAVPVYPNTMGVQTANYPWYFLNGLICGMVTKSNAVAYLTVWKNHADPYLNSNAFYFGAKLANPNVQVHVVSSYSYSDDVVAKYIVDDMMDKKGVDCFAVNQNTQTANARASERGVVSCGTSSDTRFLAGEHVFTSGIRDWNPRVLEIVKSVLDNDWVPHRLVSDGFNQSALHLAWWSTIATDPQYDHVRSAVNSWVDAMTNTSDEILFCGDRAALTTGIPWAPNQCMSLNQLLTVRNTVPGILMGQNYTRESVTVVRYIRPSDAVAIVVNTLVAILCLLLLLAAIHFNYYKNHAVYKASSYEFMMCTLCGMFLMTISCIVWSFKASPVTCALRPWIGGLGWILIVSAQLAKQHRIHVIFTLRDLKVSPITNMTQILKFMVGMFAGELAILIFWQTLAPLAPSQTVVPGLEYNEVYEYCKSKNVAPMAVFLTYNVIVIVPVVIIAWVARAVPEDYNETQSLGLSSATTIFIALFVIGGTKIVQGNIVAQYIFPTLGILIIVVAILFFIFVYKMFYLHGIWTKTTSGVFVTTTTSGGGGGGTGKKLSTSSKSVKMSRRRTDTASDGTSQHV